MGRRARIIGRFGALCVAASLVLVAGCASAPSGDQAAAPTEVVVYTSVDQVYAEPVLKEFERSSGIRVRAVYDAEAAKTTGLVNRLTAERSRPRADVWWSGEIVQTLKLADAKVLAPYRSAEASGIPANLRGAGDLWTGFGGRARVLIVSESFPGTPPSSIEDLARPAAGTDARRVAMSNPIFGTASTQAAIMYAQRGPEQASAYYDAVLDAGVTVLEGNGDVRDKVVSGELDWGLTDTDDALGAVEKGAKVRIVVPDQQPGGLGAILIPNTVGLIEGAPHPEAGRQLIDYLVSADTEQRMVADGWIQFPVRGQPDPRVSATPVTFMPVDWAAAFGALERSAADMKERFLK